MGCGMNVDVINRTIRAMCAEVKGRRNEVRDWRVLPEDELLYEVAVCAFGSQMVFEVAVASADRVREAGLFSTRGIRLDPVEFESSVASLLSKPLEIIRGNLPARTVRPRFKNRLASLLASTVTEIYGSGLSIGGLLRTARSAKEARQILVRNVWGFGPKQASLFIRRIGYCSDLAVLDVHVIDYLRLAHGISLAPARLGRLAFYEEVEDTFRDIANEFGHSVGCVDLATWLTMRVAKREANL